MFRPQSKCNHRAEFDTLHTQKANSKKYVITEEKEFQYKFIKMGTTKIRTIHKFISWITITITSPLAILSSFRAISPKWCEIRRFLLLLLKLKQIRDICKERRRHLTFFYVFRVSHITHFTRHLFSSHSGHLAGWFVNFYILFRLTGSKIKILGSYTL